MRGRCQDGRREEWRKQAAKLRSYHPGEKSPGRKTTTKDEVEWNMALNTY
jgi:hypothetical protein